ncbi:cysteine synthase B [Tenacibaculum sp. MAR_2010_89]|uniref:cysteine synthase CysM n=1 Tax=Tenacibaculum sp. MAR_2010_89 TaxID=1250198 RepID=UPI00089C4087|nr:cysteine synthase CysM [Tenacibaculum sp. MAR_2010_89]SEE28593.1 cysteine synthase B [Tenacibaculum sp. MAR_2010_89]
MKTKTIIDSVGNTPLVEISSLINKEGVRLLLKLEGNNPGGSVKDRAAYNMISEAIKRKNIKKGDSLVEATSGNTGIALALMAKVLGVNMVLVMPENATEERVKTMKSYGAEVILTSAGEGIEGSRDKALELRYKKGYFMLNQFENNDNWKAHYKTTGPEIWNDTEGEITHFVSAMGTTGTIMGVSTYLKEKNSNIQIVGAQPKEGSRIPGIRRWSPEYLPKIFDKNKVDKTIEVSREEATKMTRKLAKEEGIMAGMSSGGALHVALEVAKKIDKGIIVAIVCDRGDRYLSSELFEY